MVRGWRLDLLAQGEVGWFGWYIQYIPSMTSVSEATLFGSVSFSWFSFVIVILRKAFGGSVDTGVSEPTHDFYLLGICET